MAPSARSGGAYYVLWMFSASYVRQLPCVSILNIGNAQPANFTYTYGPPHDITSHGPRLNLPPPTPRAVAIGAFKWGERQSWGRYAGFLRPYRRARRPGRTTILAPFPGDFAQPPGDFAQPVPELDPYPADPGATREKNPPKCL